MALVDYSESGSSPSTDEEAHPPVQTSGRKRKNGHSDDDTQLEPLRTKRKQPPAHGSRITPSPPLQSRSVLPSLPSTFHSLYASSVRTSTLDDPALHSGRTRQTPHIEGNWPTHVYLEWYPSPIELSSLTQLIASNEHAKTTQVTTPPSQPYIHTLLQSPLGAQTPLHISLSAPLVLQTSQTSAFLDSLERTIATSTIKAFTVTTRALLEWVPNFDRTRWFLVVRLSRPEGDELNKLLNICNDLARASGQPTLYSSSEASREEQRSRVLGTGDSKSGAEPASGKAQRREAAASARKKAAANTGVVVPDRSDRFHISIAWTLQDPEGDRGGDPDNTADHPAEFASKKDIQISFDVVKVKIGNVVHDIPLANSAAATAATRAAM